MKNLRFFNKIEAYLFGEENIKLIREHKIDPYKVFNDMDKDSKRVVDGVGTFLYVRDTDIPYLLFVPEKMYPTDRLVLESNNCESDNKDEVLRQACRPIKYFYNVLNHPVPVMVPLIPSEKGKPYYQQLSVDMLYEKDGLNIASSVNESITDALNKIEEVSGVRLDDKIFLNGYSSSGVFAERFALLYPERVDTLCAGGASLSIPLPNSDIPYPLGTRGIVNFNVNAYKDIKFRYYVGEFEEVNIAKKDKEGNGYNDRKDVIDGEIKTVDAPMHDMTYFPRSVPVYTGFRYRQLLGKDLFTRSENLFYIYRNDGYDFRNTIIRGRAHKDMEIDGKSYKGVNECADPIIDSAYKQSVLTLSRSHKK
jgi:hypothetical protein